MNCVLKTRRMNKVKGSFFSYIKLLTAVASMKPTTNNIKPQIFQVVSFTFLLFTIAQVES